MDETRRSMRPDRHEPLSSIMCATPRVSPFLVPDSCAGKDNGIELHSVLTGHRCYSEG